jgi:WD40 repeat protein
MMNSPIYAKAKKFSLVPPQNNNRPRIHQARHVAVSRTGKYLAFMDLDGFLSVWDVKNIKSVTAYCFKYLPGEDNVTITSVTFSPDEKSLVCGYSNGTLHIWGVPGVENQSWADSLEKPASSKQNLIARDNRVYCDDVTSLTFSANGEYLVCGQQSNLIMFSFEQNFYQPPKRHRDRNDLAGGVAIDPDGKYVAYGRSRDCSISFISMEGEELAIPSLRYHDHVVNIIAISPDGKYLASGSRDKSVCIWEKLNDTGQFKLVRIHQIDHDAVASMAFSPDGESLAFGCKDGTVHILHTKHKEFLSQLRLASLALGFTSESLWVCTAEGFYMFPLEEVLNKEGVIIY